MTSTLLDLSANIDPQTVSVLNRIQQVALKECIQFFVVGAKARDILLENAHGMASKRATIDIDIAVSLENWAQFDQLRTSLLHSPDFEPGRDTQRLIFRSQLPVDLIPFGGIAEANDHIEWPPDKSFKMSVAGFDECYQHCISIKLANTPELIIQVVSLSGLVILKLISWEDNPGRRRRDAPDLFFIIQNYLDAGNLDRLFNENLDLIQTDNYDYELTSARLLGRDISRIASPQTKTALVQILEREASNEHGHRIAMEVIQSDGFKSLDYDRIVAHFNSMLKGLSEHN